MNDLFRKFANAASTVVGSPWAFMIAVASIIAWALTGPLFHFSDTWQLLVNTGTTLVTFLMVFLIQNTQNRDAKAIHLKLDELIRSNQRARNGMVDLEHLTDAEIAALQEQFKRVHLRAKDPVTGQTLEALEDELEERQEEHGERQPERQEQRKARRQAKSA